MIRLPCLACLLSIPGAAVAAERHVAIGSVERVRIEGTGQVTILTGASPDVRITGNRRAIEATIVRIDATTLSIRIVTADDAAAVPVTPATVTISTPSLRGIAVIGGAIVTAGRMQASAIDLSLSGTGQLGVAAISADRATATVIGNGSISVAGGRTGTLRLVTNGGGGIDAAGVVANDLSVHADGPGTVKAQARYTAQVVDGGLGSVAVTGAPKCVVRAPAGGTVSCGVAH